MKNKLLIIVPLAAAALLLVTAPNAKAAIISTESFFTTTDGAGDTYVSGSNIGFTVSTGSKSNRDVINGNTNFNGTGTVTAERWNNSNSSVKPDSTTSLTHNGLVGTTSSTTFAGSMLVDPVTAVERNSTRQMDNAAPLSGTYYLSGLVLYSGGGALSSSQSAAIGFQTAGIATNTFDITTGFHLGVREDASGNASLAAYAGGSSFNLATPVDGTTYQIVLKLDVNDTGNDTLTAWYAASGDTSLTLGLAATSIETWTSVASLRSLTSLLTAQANGTGVFFDEIRFGTEQIDVTSLVVPEPSTFAMLLGGMGMLTMIRRRR